MEFEKPVNLRKLASSLTEETGGETMVELEVVRCNSEEILTEDERRKRKLV